MAKKLTMTQKAANQRKYAMIRKGWESTDKSITYKQFKNRVEAQKVANDLTTREAVKKVINSEQFTSPAERSRVNLLKGLKENFRDDYNTIRELSRWNETGDGHKKGQYRSLEENLRWDKDRGGYIITGIYGQYFIDVTNSPEEVNIYAI